MATRKKKATPATAGKKAGSASATRKAAAGKVAKGASSKVPAAARRAAANGASAKTAAAKSVSAKSTAAKPPTAKSAPAKAVPGAKPAPAAHPSDGVLRTAKGVPVKDKPWGKKDLAHFEKRLMEERRRVMKQLAQWDESMRSTIQNADGDLSAYSFHMADQGTDAMEREKAFLFASKEGRYLWHIDQALRRLYKSPETFGICEMTGERIEFERLDALPHARLSYKAKRQEEGVDEAE